MKTFSAFVLGIFLFCLSVPVAIAGDYTIFGPQVFTRLQGKPVVETVPVAAPVAGASFSVKAQNGTATGGFPVSSAQITLNGQRIFKPSDFNQQVQRLSAQASLGLSNTLQVQLEGKPQSSIELTITGTDNVKPIIRIESPVTNVVLPFDQAFVTIIGSIIDDTLATINVNGVPAAINGQTFVADNIPLVYGSNIITATATDLGGNTAEALVTITRQFPPPSLEAALYPDIIDYGQTASLSWSSIFADQVLIEPALGTFASNGTLTVAPQEDVTYTLMAIGPGGTTSREVSLRVTQPVPEVVFSVEPKVILNGLPISLQWETKFADSITIEPSVGPVAPQGSLVLYPSESTTYTLAATGRGGITTSRVPVVVTYPQPTVTFDIQPKAIILGGTISLSWSSTDADSVTIEPNIGQYGPSGTVTLVPTATTTYTVTATGKGGAAVSSATVVVSNPAPEITFSANPQAIYSGEISTLSWTSKYADTISISPNIGLVASHGNINVTPTQSTVYTLSAHGQGGVATAQTSVTVMANIPPQPPGSFGEQYDDLVPANAEKEDFDPKRFALVTGKVENQYGQPLAGVTVSVNSFSCASCHGLEYGSVATDAQGQFTLPVEGGTTVTVVYQKEGFITSHRQVYVPWNDIAITDTIEMIPFDTKATTITFSGNPQSVMVHRGSTVTDGYGTRAYTMVFTGDNTAYEVSASGSIIRTLPSITTRATEFSTLESMPAQLPPETAFTYCAELSVDGVERIKFAKPVVNYLENFLGLPVGEIVPIGYYDRDQGRWIASKNGVVVKLLDQNGDGYVDALDSSGNGLPNDLNGNGSFSDEVAGLSDPVAYPPNATFWRGEVDHFTPYDWNLPWGWPGDAVAPNPAGIPVSDQQRPNQQDCQTQTNSYVEDRSRIFHEDIPIAGTDLTLHYASNRVDGYKTIISVPASGSNVPASLERIIVQVDIAGRRFNKILPAMSNQIAEFAWDGRDQLGRVVTGRVSAHVKIGFEYFAVYRFGSRSGLAFGQPGTGSTGIDTRIRMTRWQETGMLVERDSFGPDEIAAGWTLSSQHRVDPKNPGTLYMGDGEKRTHSSSIVKNVATGILYPHLIASDAAGNIYVTEAYTSGIHKISPDGTKTLIANIASRGFSGDSGPLLNAMTNSFWGDIEFDSQGNMYILDYQNNRVRKVDSSGIIRTIVGNGIRGTLPVADYNGKKATEVPLSAPRGLAVDKQGNIYISTYNVSSPIILKIGTDGLVRVVAGTGTYGTETGDGGMAINARLSNNFTSLEMDNEGNLFIGAWRTIRKIDPAGIITRVAGDPNVSASAGDGGLAINATFDTVREMEIDSQGNLIVLDKYNSIRIIYPSGVIRRLMGSGVPGGITPGVSPFDTPMWGEYIHMAIDPKGTLYLTEWHAEGFRDKTGVWKIENSTLDNYTQSGDIAFAEEAGVLHLLAPTGQHKQTLDLATRKVLKNFSYNSSNRLQSITDQFGNQLRLDYTSGGVVITSADGVQTQLDINDDGHLEQVRYPDGTSYRFDYDADGLMLSETNPKGDRFDHVFDSMGRLAVVNDPEGGAWRYAQANLADGYQETVKTTAEGNVTTYRDRSNPDQSTTSTIYGPNGSMSTFTTSANGLSETAALSCGMTVTTQYGLDPQYKFKTASTVSEKTPAGLTRNSSRAKTYQDVNGDKVPDRITETSTLNGKSSNLLIDTQLSKIESTSPLGRKVTGYYNPQTLRLARQSVSGLLDVQYGYDAKGRLGTVSQGTRQTSFTYDENGYLQKIVAPDQKTTVYSRDELGRVTSVVRPDNTSLYFDYDDNGNLTLLTNPRNVEHAFEYNSVDANVGYRTPQSGSYRYQFDRDRRLKETVFPSGMKITNYYSGNQLDYTLTPEGEIDYNYLCATKLGSMSKGGETLSYAYDGKLVTAETLAGTLNQGLGYTYNSDFNVTSMSYAGGTASFSYDNDGLLVGTSGFTISRDSANGLPKTVSGGTFSMARSFSGYGEMLSETLSVAGVNRYGYSLTRGVTGNIENRTETVSGAAINYVYNYDDLGRLTNVTKDGALVEQYQYDSVGRRIYEMNSQRGIGGRNFAYSDEDHLLSAGDTAYQYDVDGFLATKTSPAGSTAYTYSSRGELLKVVQPDSKVIEYVHDPQGRRIAKKVNGVITEKYLWQGLTRLLAVYDGGNSLIMRFQYADGRLPVAMTKGGATYYLGYDQVGSLRIVTDNSGNTVKRIDYDSFGNILNDSNPTFAIPFGFAGGMCDQDTNLVRFGYRDYNPEIGRWTAKDPIGFAGGDIDVFGYVQNNVVNWIDPWGLWTFQIGSGGTIGGGAGGTVTSGFAFGYSEKNGLQFGLYSTMGGGGHGGATFGGSYEFLFSTNDSICDLAGNSATIGGSVTPGGIVGAGPEINIMQGGAAPSEGIVFGLGWGTPVEEHGYVTKTTIIPLW